MFSFLFTILPYQTYVGGVQAGVLSRFKSRKYFMAKGGQVFWVWIDALVTHDTVVTPQRRGPSLGQRSDGTLHNLF